MSLERLVAMVNDIAAFFSAEAGADAPDAVAAHLRRFWAPRMRHQLLQAHEARAPELQALSETGLRALRRLSGDGRPS